MPSHINSNLPPRHLTHKPVDAGRTEVSESPHSGSISSTSSSSVGEMTSEMAQVIGRTSAPATQSVLETYFAPYDEMRSVECQLLDEVIAARKADPKSYPEGENPYKINYAVYNISSKVILEKLVEADKAGVDVQILIEDQQLSPQKTWNKGDDFLIEHGFEFAPNHNTLTPEERKTKDLIGIKRSSLMHLKSRIIQYPDPKTHKMVKKVLTGSMNPGRSAVNNDENLSLITDPKIVDKYIAMYEAVRDNGKIVNKFDEEAPINVMFTGKAVKGESVTRRIFKQIDQEQEAIFLSIFTLRNLTAPRERENLIQKLKAAKERGVEVVVITDHKQADGVDAEGNHRWHDDPTEDKLRSLGIPVYEALNESGPYNAMHAKVAIFGLSHMKVITDTGNWTKAALGGKHARGPQNDESFLFIDSGKLDDNKTGLRYLGNFLYLLRKYDEQNPKEMQADQLINRLAQNPNWPRVEVDFSVMAHTFMGQEVYVTGDHPALGNWLQEGPGLKLNTQPGKYPFWESGGSLKLPFGTIFHYKIVKKNPDGRIEWESGKNAILIVDPTDKRFNDNSSDPLKQIQKDQF